MIDEVILFDTEEEAIKYRIEQRTGGIVPFSNLDLNGCTKQMEHSDINNKYKQMLSIVGDSIFTDKDCMIGNFAVWVLGDGVTVCNVGMRNHFVCVREFGTIFCTSEEQAAWLMHEVYLRYGLNSHMRVHPNGEE